MEQNVISGAPRGRVEEREGDGRDLPRPVTPMGSTDTVIIRFVGCSVKCVFVFIPTFELGASR